MTRLLLLEDTDWVRESVAELLSAPGTGISVVGAHATVAAARRAVDFGPPFDAALVDLGLPDGSGLEVIGAIRARRPNAAVVVFTVFDEPATVFAALQRGACGYLLKSTPATRLVPHLVEALAGGAPMSPSIARLVVQSFACLPSVACGPSADILTPREREVLTLIAKGVSYPEVARMLGVGLGTVQRYVKSIYPKLEVNSKAEAALAAARMGLV